MRDDFGLFILSHGRPNLASLTITALNKSRYTGKWWLILDTDDPTADQYAARWGADRILTFDKAEVAGTFDICDNASEPSSVVVYARNAVPALSADLGLTYYMQIDDDYTYFAHRLEKRGSLTYAYSYHLDDVIEAFIDFLDDSGALTVAFAQGGDFIGGVYGSFRRRVLRKAMNTFIARVDRPVLFTGRINEDVNAYVSGGSRGDLYLTLTDFAMNQINTQQQEGGLTGAYLDLGTYVKSMYTVIQAPSCVKVSTIGDTSQRVHHLVFWNNAVPKIVSSAHKKQYPPDPDVRILSGEVPHGDRTRQETAS